ncbi:MAG TPA: regulatory protein RecX [Gemmatimonadales bacterium]|nr:regulatory protein RecX [Gemmatimonadales bacterium]
MTATASEPTRVIGAVVPDPRHPGSVRLMVQGRLLLTIPREVAEAERLEAGSPISGAGYGRLCRAADEEAGYRTALRVLGRRPFATRDLLRRLILKGHPPEAAAAAVDRAGRAGLLDDGRFARHYISTRAARGRGPQRLRRDLVAQGVDPRVVDQALGDCLGPDGEAGPQAEELARRRLRQLRGLPQAVRRRRVLAFLFRRGFTGLSVRKTVAALLSE